MVTLVVVSIIANENLVVSVFARAACFLRKC